MMEAVRTSETSVHSKDIVRRSIAEGPNRHIRRRENVKSHASKKSCKSVAKLVKPMNGDFVPDFRSIFDIGEN
jgi:hypothetical protein